MKLKTTFPVILTILFTIFVPFKEAYAQRSCDSEQAIDVAYLTESDRVNLADIRALDEKAWTALDSSTLHKGFTSNAYWLRIKPNCQLFKDSYLTIDYPLLGLVDYYLIGDEKKLESFHAGTRIPFSDRPVQTIYPTFPISISSHQDVLIFLRVESLAALSVPLKIKASDDIIEAESLNMIFWSLIFGILFAMLLNSLILLMTIGSKSYACYGLYIAATLWFFSYISGFGFRYIWQNNPYLNDAFQFLSALAVIFMVVAFTRKFLSTKRNLPTMDAAFRAVMGLCLLALVAQQILPFNINLVTVSLGQLSVTLCLITGALALARKNHYAKYYIAGWVLYLVSVLIYTSSLTRFFPVNVQLDWLMPAASTIQMVLLSLALADKISLLRIEKLKAVTGEIEAQVETEKLQKDILYRSTHDLNTLLPKMSYLELCENKRLSQITQSNFKLYLVGLDNYHEITKTLGNQNGAALIRLVAERLHDFAANTSDCVEIERGKFLYHVRENTFAFAVSHGVNERARSIAIQKRFCGISRSFELLNMQMEVKLSLGIASSDSAENLQEILRHAEIALENAANLFAPQVYTSESDPYSQRRLTLMSELREAIRDDALALYYQPQIDMKNGNVISAEALVRWHNPRLGMVSPDEFIPLAESTGMITLLTRWVLDRAVKDIKCFKENNLNIRVSVNLSSNNILESGFCEKISRLVSQQGVSPRDLVLEITETAMMTDIDKCHEVLRSLDSKGFDISIDDFGTGYSSLAYLKKLPVDELKIDRAFVMNLDTNEEDRVIVKSMLEMAKSLSLKVVAEGIENREIYQILCDMGCDVAQGYYFSKPISRNDFIRYNQEVIAC